ncbi:MAG: SH3 domain-containing protein, partial [bacterium]
MNGPEEDMRRITLVTCMLALLTFATACDPKNKGFEHYWVISQEVDVVTLAHTENKVLGTLKFGDEVLGRKPNLGAVFPKQWLEVKFGNGRGYVDRTNLGDKAMIDEMNNLIASVKESQVQGVGETRKRIPLRLRPSSSSPLIEIIKKPAKVEVFERAVVEKEKKGTSGKEVWYKVRVEDGRIGYVPDMISLVTPSELNQYTAAREAVAWREIDEKEDPATGAKGKEYIVAYLSAGTPIDVDFSRIELYTYDPKSSQYATSLAKGGLLG